MLFVCSLVVSYVTWWSFHLLPMVIDCAVSLCDCVCVYISVSGISQKVADGYCSDTPVCNPWGDEQLVNF